MRFTRAVAVLALLSSSALAFAQVRPMVESIQPDSGPPAGGTVVTIRGAHLGNIAPPLSAHPRCTPCPSYPPVVRFGDKLGQIRSYDDETIVVETPPNAGGAYDLEIGGFYSGTTIVPRAFQYGTNAFDRILVPLVANRVPGAFGSIWSTELVGRNDSTTRIEVSQFVDALPNPLPEWSGGDPKTTFRPALVGNAALLYHEHVSETFGFAPLAFSLRVRDLSRQADSWGTEVPLVRAEDAFVGRRMDILNVPFEPESRITLRIYDLDGPTGGDVPVYVRSNESDALLGTTILHLPGGPYLNAPPTPGYVALDLRSIVTSEIGVQTVRVQVGEEGLQKRLWSFVAITDLETQQVTLVTPVR